MIWLLLRGYNILAQRYKHSQGEIDIIARKKNLVAFIEVKRRNTLEEALESITALKRARTQQAALAFLAGDSRLSTLDSRFDVMAVTAGWRIHHITQAW